MADYDRHAVCALLRSKQMYTHVDPEHKRHQTTGLTEVFWCNLTMTGTGPDDSLCCHESCTAGRWCHRDPLS